MECDLSRLGTAAFLFEAYILLNFSQIIGATQNAAMNALHPLAVYAAVKQHRGEKLDFPGNTAAWLENHEHSTAQLTGYLSEWAVLEDKVEHNRK